MSAPDLPVFKLPPVFETKLANGLEVLLVEDRRFPMVTMRLGFQAGSKYEPEELAGLSESTAALLSEGTRRRSAREIAEEIASMGGVLRGDSSGDVLMVAASALSENLEKLLELAADVARNAVFPEEEVALHKQNRTQELLAARSEASFLADEKYTELVYSPHPYAWQDPTVESIARLDRAALIDFRDRHLTPENGSLLLLGALPERERTLELIEREFGAWERRTPPAPPAARFPEPRREIVLVDRPGSVQADIRIGRLAVPRMHPDYFPLLVGNTILGGGASSRLFTNIREKQGFAYEVRSSVQPLKDAGSFAIVTEVRNEVLEPAITGLLGEMKRICTEAVTAEELAAAKNYLSGVFVIRLETQDGLASQMAAVKLLGLPVQYLEKYTERVRAVTPEQIRGAAARHMDPERAALVVVGDSAAIGRQMETFGAVVREEAK